MNINNAESADPPITLYLAMTHYWSILWPQIPPLVFRPFHQKAFHLSCYRMWPHQRFPLSCWRWAKRAHSLLSIQIHPEVLSGRTKINFKLLEHCSFNLIDYVGLSKVSSLETQRTHLERRSWYYRSVRQNEGKAAVTLTEKGYCLLINYCSQNYNYPSFQCGSTFYSPSLCTWQEHYKP